MYWFGARIWGWTIMGLIFWPDPHTDIWSVSGQPPTRISGRRECLRPDPHTDIWPTIPNDPPKPSC